MKEDKNEKKARLPYEKPVVKAIDLAAEEVLVVGCKTDGAVAGFGNDPAPFCSAPTVCHGQGS